MYKNYDLIVVPKSWGFEKIITNNKKYCGKILYFHKGKKCSFHYHRIKEEHFYIQSGQLKVLYSFSDKYDFGNALESDDHGIISTPEKGVVILEPGDVFHVPIGMRHQMIGLLDTYMFEFSTTDDPNDSIRVIKGD